VTSPVVVDTTLSAYKVAGAKKPWFVDPRSILKSGRAMGKGFRQSKTRGTALQNGGVFLITPDGRMPYRYISDYAGDHPDPEAPVSALEKLGAPARG
jgi:hypothetical protein